MVQAMNQEQFSALMGELVYIARSSQAAVQASAEVVTRIGQMNLGQSQSSDGRILREQQDPGADVALDTDEARALSVRLYAVLTSYLRGSALQLSRSMSSSKNGLQLWKVLVNQYAPATKQRSLAISQAIATYPGFTRDKTFAESIAGLEQLVNEYFVVTNFLMRMSYWVCCFDVLPRV